MFREGYTDMEPFSGEMTEPDIRNLFY